MATKKRKSGKRKQLFGAAKAAHEKKLRSGSAKPKRRSGPAARYRTRAGRRVSGIRKSALAQSSARRAAERETQIRASYKTGRRKLAKARRQRQTKDVSALKKKVQSIDGRLHKVEKKVTVLDQALSATRKMTRTLRAPRR